MIVDLDDTQWAALIADLRQVWTSHPAGGDDWLAAGVAKIVSSYESMRRPLLTADEHKAMSITGELANTLARVVGNDTSRGHDINELMGHVHVLQHAIMSQAAARAYPDLYRRLGETLKARQ